jgi:ParB-like chromosome segregation protein Spo0J
MDDTNILSELNTMMRRDPMAEARRMRALAGNGMTQAQIAQELGVTQSLVSQRLALLKLIPVMQKALEDGAIDMRTARVCSGMSVDEQEQLAHEWWDDKDYLQGENDEPCI